MPDKHEQIAHTIQSLERTYQHVARIVSNPVTAGRKSAFRTRMNEAVGKVYAIAQTSIDDLGESEDIGRYIESWNAMRELGAMRGYESPDFTSILAFRMTKRKQNARKLKT